MQTDGSSDFQLIKIGLGLVATGIMGFMGWMGKRQVKRIDDIEKNYVSKDDFNATTNSLRTEIHEGNKGTHERLDKMMMLLASKGRAE